MRAGEREPVLDLLEEAFSERDLFASYMDDFPGFEPGDFLLACDGERPVSSVQIFRIPVRFGDAELQLGGIGSVACLKSHRSQGLASALMRRAAEEMRARDMPIGLLFTGRFTFYEPLGWHQMPRPMLSIRRSDSGAVSSDAFHIRVFESADLPAVREIYDAYNADHPWTTIRDDAYWRGQLRYAGTPDEDFRVVVSGGAIVAYARGITIEGVPFAMEYGRLTDRADELSAVLLAIAPESARMALHTSHDSGLLDALNRADADPQPADDPSAMWKVLDPRKLRSLIGVEAEVEDEALLQRLVGEPGSIYWLSDRF